jgi:NADPH:quinone reductase-like Zn-dependent oxidoreductase
VRAIVQERYGPPDVLELRDVVRPVIGDEEVLIRVRAASVNPVDWHFIEGLPHIMRLMGSGLLGPKRRFPGVDVAGEVEAVGKSVPNLRTGDAVFGWCEGAFAEYACASESQFVRKPDGLTFEQAAAVPLAATTALQGLRDLGQVQPGQEVLIIGAGGGVGTFAVQIARSLGAEVTAVCSGGKAEMVRSIGADHVIDYTREDFTEGEQRYEVIFELAGDRPSSHLRRALTPKGTLVLSSGDGGGRWLGPMGRIVWSMASAPFVSQKVVTWVTSMSRADLVALKELIEAGKVTPVIDRSYPLDEVPEAIRYLEEGHARGKIVITV